MGQGSNLPNPPPASGLHDAANHCALTQHVVVEAEARLRISSSMSAPLPGYAESGYTEPKEDRTQNKVIQNPGTPAQNTDRKASKARSRVLASMSRSRLERGSDQAAPSSVRELMALNRLIRPPRGRTAGHLSGSDRATRRPTEEIRRGATPVGQGRLAVSTVGKKRLH